MQKYRDTRKQGTSDKLQTRLNAMEAETKQLIDEFDLTGDHQINPEEFFNIIMFAYGF